MKNIIERIIDYILLNKKMLSKIPEDEVAIIDIDEIMKFNDINLMIKIMNITFKKLDMKVIAMKYNDNDNKIKVENVIIG